MGERAQERDDDIVTVVDASGNETQMTRADARAAGLQPVDAGANPPDAGSDAQPDAGSEPA